MPLSAPQAAFIEDKFSDSADKYWELFYRQNGNRLYKDRHYFAREFPELVSRPGCAVLECGCGAGNSAYPLVEENPTCRVYACDFSPRAVELVKRHPLYASGRVTAFVADITRPDHLPGSHVPPGTVDFATCVFVLSAIHPDRIAEAVANIKATLKPESGTVCFRDYAEGDLAHKKLAGMDGRDRGRMLSDSFYVRGDGTCCYFFSEDAALRLFENAGFKCRSLVVQERWVDNRARGIRMHRRWIQGVFSLDPSTVREAYRITIKETETVRVPEGWDPERGGTGESRGAFWLLERSGDETNRDVEGPNAAGPDWRTFQLPEESAEGKRARRMQTVEAARGARKRLRERGVQVAASVGAGRQATEQGCDSVGGMAGAALDATAGLLRHWGRAAESRDAGAGVTSPSSPSAAVVCVICHRQTSEAAISDAEATHGVPVSALLERGVEGHERGAVVVVVVSLPIEAACERSTGDASASAFGRGQEDDSYLDDVLLACAGLMHARPDARIVLLRWDGEGRVTGELSRVVQLHSAPSRPWRLKSPGAGAEVRAVALSGAESQALLAGRGARQEGAGPAQGADFVLMGVFQQQSRGLRDVCA